MSTDARDLAARYYRDSSRRMAEDAALLAMHPQGFIICRPELLVLAKDVRSDAPETWEELRVVSEAPDALYIHLLAGDLRLARRMAAALPPRRYLCFRRGLRGERPHLLRWERFFSLPVAAMPHTPQTR